VSYQGKDYFPVQESAAILLYLLKRVDKEDKLGFADDLERNECLQWVMWQMGGLGPMLGRQ
jgi:glutathione S-transferase